MTCQEHICNKQAENSHDKRYGLDELEKEPSQVIRNLSAAQTHMCLEDMQGIGAKHHAQGATQVAVNTKQHLKRVPQSSRAADSKAYAAH